MSITGDDPPPNDLPSDVPKRPLSPTDNKKSPRNKKVRLSFSTKELRKQLKSEQKTQALQGFLRSIEESQDCILTYLQHGGSALEVLQTMEGESGARPELVFDVVNRILLQIGANLPQYQNGAYDACRYLLNTYLAQINKMLGLGSWMKERLVTLKLLTTIVTFSAVLAKDVLLHVNFNPTNLELLTKIGEGKNEARSAFIHLITAFLVDGHFPTLSVLLEKRGFMTSIINGLRFDKADVVVLVLTAMKNHILENASVSKTIKMKTFNTQVVRDIVNLYNWKGPAGITDQKKKQKTVPVDQIAKSKVNEAVHSFLLVLCTSHKHGVIFKDPLVGLGKSQNSLMLTILDSLVRPWEHSYAGELVTKICQACPDLARTVWTTLKSFLEPRWTEKWLKAMKFAEKLLGELQPDCIEFAVSNLNVQQMGQVITILTSPLPILKSLIPDDDFDKPATKYRVMSLLLKMLNSVENFLKQAKCWKSGDHEALSAYLANHIQKNFPRIEFILMDWHRNDEALSVSDYLDTALDIFEKYKLLAPQTVENSNIEFDFKDFITKSETIIDESRLRRLQVKAASFFIDLEPFQFGPKTELFEKVIAFSLEHYYSSKDPKVSQVLNKLLGNTEIFDGCENEIDFWIDGVLNLKNYDPNIATFLSDFIENVEDNVARYIDGLFQSKGSNFSVLILALGDYFSEHEASKNVKNYLNFVILNIFHVQNDLNIYMQIISKMPYLSDSLHTYILGWTNLEATVLPKLKGKLIDHFHIFSTNFLQNASENFDCDYYPNHKLNILQMVIFYLTNLVKADSLNDNHKKNCTKFLDYLISEKVFEDDRYVKTILTNPSLVDNFNLYDSNDFSTRFVLDVVKNLKSSVLEDYLVDFRHKAASSLSKMFRKPEKYENLVVSIEILETISLNYEQCSKLLTKFANSSDNKFFYLIACYCLNRMAELGRNYNSEPLENDTVKHLSHIFKLLIEGQISTLNLFSSSLHTYLRVFPHNIEGVETDVFDSLVLLPEFHKDNLSLCEFLLDRKPECLAIFEKNLDEICSKRSFILALLDVVIDKYTDDTILQQIFTKFESHIVKALQKPHKAGQHFQNRYQSVGILIEKFMKPDGFGTQVQKFETTELFHVYLLKKVYDKIEKNAKILGNMIMTFVHLVVNLLRQKSGAKAVDNLDEIGRIFFKFLEENQGVDVTFLSSNETLRTLCKLCLKHGIAGDFVLIKILNELIQLCIVEEDAKIILEMFFSHSQFLDVILGDSQKLELLNLWKTICTRWPQVMERNHVPVLLSAYKATNSEKVTLSLLKMYESQHDQTKFFDFKPFLWGRAAASHYSVRSDFRKALWRQPKMADVLSNLHLGSIASTITDPSAENSYDLDFFLPLFSHLLAPENPVTTYKFTKTGALALALTGLRGDQTQRLATCHILQRFYFHLESKQSGKDNLLWLRLVEAICKGVSVFEDFKINSFVGIFLARTALVMTQPTDVMYVPLTQYLAAKEHLDFSGVPELYTFLFSPHVNSKEHNRFILELLRDGLREDNDFKTLMKTMGFKLISELCASTVCDTQTKLLVLEVFEACLKIQMGVKVLCELSFLPQIFGLVLQNGNEGPILVKLVQILSKIVEVDKNRHRNFIVYLNLVTIFESEQYFRALIDCKGLATFYKVLMVIAHRFPDFVGKDFFDDLLVKSGDQFCAYMVRFGCRFIKQDDFAGDSELQYLRTLFYQKLKVR